MKKRVEKELVKINSDLKNNFYLYENNYPNIEIYIIPTNNLLYSNRYLLSIKIKITNFYPFEPPEIKVNNYSYISLLKISGSDLGEYFNLSTKCLCCISKTCKNNWAPIFGLKDLLKEIENNIILKIRLIEKIHCKKIINKYLFNDIPILDYI